MAGAAVEFADFHSAVVCCLPSFSSFQQESLEMHFLIFSCFLLTQQYWQQFFSAAETALKV